ncbi:MAG: APC family permease [Acidobacteriota bacterium]
MSLFREINLPSSTFLVIGNILGVGIFVTSGEIAQRLGSSFWLIGVWGLGGLLALIGAICYSLLAIEAPKAGGEYALLYPAYGPLPAFLSGWASLLMGFSAPIAAAALGFGYYLEPFLPSGWLGNASTIKAVALVAVLLVSIFVSLGLRFGARLHSLVTLLNVGLVLGFSIAVLGREAPAGNLGPILNRSWLEVEPTALGSAVILVMFSYSGWNAAVYIAEEIRSPRRNIPAALILGTLAVMAAYLLINLSYFDAVPLADLKGKEAVAEITALHAFGRGGAQFVNLLILSSMLSSLTAMSIAGPRVYFAMARDRLFPHWLSHVNEKRKLPLKAIWFQSGVALVLIAVASLYEILYYSGTILLLFSTLTVSVVLRTSQGGRSPLRFWMLYRILPLTFVITNGLVLLNAVVHHSGETLAGAVTVAAGVPVYLFYRRKDGSRSAG